MMTRSHIRALLHAVLSVWLLFLGSSTAYAQLTANFNLTLPGTCIPRKVLCNNISKGYSKNALFIWDFGNGVIDTTRSISTVPSSTYTIAQNYSVTLTIRDGSRASFKTRSVSVAPNPVTAFTVSTRKGCLPLTDTFTCSPQNQGNPINYFWDFGDGTTETTTSAKVIHTFTSSGSNFIQFLAVNEDNCTLGSRFDNLIQFTSNCGSSLPGDTATNHQPAKDATVSFSMTTPQYLTNSICPPVLVDFSGKAEAVTALEWDFGDGSKAFNTLNPSHTFHTQGRYYITFKGRRSDATIVSKTDSVFVLSPLATVKVDVAQNCVGAAVTLRASTLNGSTYSWNFGDGVVVTKADTIVTHRYEIPGIYTPYLIMADSMGCGDYFYAPKVVIDSLQAGFKTNGQHVCDSAMLHFSAGATSLSTAQLGEPLSYHWSFGTANPGDTASTATFSYIYRVPGKYPVSLTVKSVPGCTYTHTDTVLVTTSAHGEITGPSAICAETRVLFAASVLASAVTTPNGTPVGPAGTPNAPSTGTAAPAGSVSWQWLFPGGQTDTARNATLVAANPGSYMVKLVVGLNGCSDTSTMALLVHPQPDIALSPKDPMVCQGNSVTVSAHDGVSYQWGPAPGLSSYTSNNPIATPKISTTYRVQAVNQYGCTNADSTLVFVAPPITVHLPADTFVCQGGSVVLNPSGAYTYQWIAGLSPSGSTDSSLTLSPLANTSYEVVGYDQYHCFTDTARVNVNIEPLPTVKTVPVGSLIAGNSVTLQTDASPDVVSWEWSPGDYLSCTDCSAPVSSPKTSIQYTVTGKTEYGCPASDTVSIKLVCMDDEVRIPNAFTPNNDGMNDIFYPMGKGVRVVSSLRIYGRWGNLVFERHDFQLDDKSNGWNGQAGGVDQPTGSYIYEMVLICDTGDVFTKKGTVLLER